MIFTSIDGSNRNDTSFRQAISSAKYRFLKPTGMTVKTHNVSPMDTQ